MENNKKKGSNVIENHFKTSKNEEKFLLLMRDLNRFIKLNSDFIFLLFLVIVFYKIQKKYKLKTNKNNI